MTSPFAARFFSLRTPLRFLRGSYTRLTLTVIAIACGVALVCAIDLADRAVMRAFVEVMGTAAGRVALQVRAGEGAPFPEEVAATVAGVPGVELATPVVSGTAVTADGTEELLTVLGLDVADEAAMRAYGAPLVVRLPRQERTSQRDRLRSNTPATAVVKSSRACRAGGHASRAHH